MRRRTLIGAAAATGLAGIAHAQPEPVDVALVLAVDVSRSVDDDEARLQREGYRQAVMSPAVLRGIEGGMTGAIALTYVEWAGWQFQTQTIPWTRIGGARDAAGFADAIAAMPRVSLNWTSISGAILFSLDVLARCPFEPTRRVIDISGDGVNNSGPPVEESRDEAVRAGVVINGLPIVNERPGFGWLTRGMLEQHYRERVIGGPGAFIVIAGTFETFGAAVLRKLVREIA